MRKIKGLKIPIYYYDIERKTKKEGINIIEIFGKDNLDNSFKEFVSNIISHIEISAIYSNFNRTEIEKMFPNMLNIISKNSPVVSIALVSSGNKIEEKLSTLNPMETKLSNIIINVYFSTAVKYINDIISEEAKKDNFEIGNTFFLYDFGYNIEKNVYDIINHICPNKISVEIKENKIYPYYTKLFYTEWNLVKKR